MKKLLLAIFVLNCSIGFAQVNTSYFFQTSSQYKSEQLNVLGEKSNPSAFSFQMQQLNIVANSNLGEGFSGYVNIELTNSTNTLLNFGGISIEDVFVKYNYNNYLNIKAGHFTPRFNSFIETYNKFPLLPYIIRPFFYEKAWAAMVPPEDILPQKAALQIYGYFPFGDYKFDYSAFLGNPENSFLLVNGEDPTAEPGTNKTDYITYGGRVGIRNDIFTLGFSLSKDKDNLSLLNPAMEDLDRLRIGGDLNIEYEVFGNLLKLNGEFIMVKYLDAPDDLEPWGDWIFLNEVNVANGKEIQKPKSLDKLAFFVTLSYNLTEEFYLYGTYNQFTDEYSPIFLDGLKGPFIGAGYNFNYQTSLKFQYEHTEVHDGMILYNGDLYRFAISVAL